MINPKLGAVVRCIADDVLEAKDQMVERGLGNTNQARICTAIEIWIGLEAEVEGDNLVGSKFWASQKETVDAKLKSALHQSSLQFSYLGPACVSVDFLEWIYAIGVTEADASRRLQPQLARDYPIVYLEFLGLFVKNRCASAFQNVEFSLWIVVWCESRSHAGRAVHHLPKIGVWRPWLPFFLQTAFTLKLFLYILSLVWVVSDSSIPRQIVPRHWSGSGANWTEWSHELIEGGYIEHQQFKAKLSEENKVHDRRKSGHLINWVLEWCASIGCSGPHCRGLCFRTCEQIRRQGSFGLGVDFNRT